MLCPRLDNQSLHLEKCQLFRFENCKGSSRCSSFYFENRGQFSYFISPSKAEDTVLYYAAASPQVHQIANNCRHNSECKPCSILQISHTMEAAVPSARNELFQEVRSKAPTSLYIANVYKAEASLRWAQPARPQGWRQFDYCQILDRIDKEATRCTESQMSTRWWCFWRKAGRLCVFPPLTNTA